MSFTIQQFAAGSCYSYIVSAGKDSLIIDPHISLTAEYDRYIKKGARTLRFIIDTHTHADHFSLAAVLKERYGATVLMHERAISSVADKRLKDADAITLGGQTLAVRYAPGHTDDTINIYTGDALFTGDVMLIASVGRTDFQNGSPESMFDTLQSIQALPDKTIVYPGHDYHEKKSSTIGSEKQSNPFLQEKDKQQFVRTMRSKTLAKPFNIDNIVRVNQKGEAMSLVMVSASAASEMTARDRRIRLLDVRSPFEYAQAHIKDSISMPIETLTVRAAELSKDNAYIVFCRTGNRSPMAADMLRQVGFHDIKIMEGGMIAWQKEHLPVIKGEGGMSLERQVRVLAGTFVLVGIVLSWLIHPGFLGISLFVSCGLIYAGLSDNCLMGALLMKLPYNRKLYKHKLGGGTCSIGG